MKCSDKDVVIGVSNITKEYKGDNNVVALKEFSYEFIKGKFYCITGHSGAGKSTMLQIIGLLDKPSSGQVYFDEKDVTDFSERKKSQIRMKKIGFVFQSFYLMPHLNSIENVMSPMLINSKIALKDRKKRAMELLELVGMSHRAEHLPRQLSGGEQQRVAIARALANDPEIILADEPTGNVDKENEDKILKIFEVLQRKGKTIIVITHNDEVAKRAEYLICMEGGQAVNC